MILLGSDLFLADVAFRRLLLRLLDLFLALVLLQSLRLGVAQLQGRLWQTIRMQSVL